MKSLAQTKHQLSALILALAAITVTPFAHAQTQEAACVLGVHDGIEEFDASTVATLVCGELRKAGLPVALKPVTLVDANAATYRTELHRLGQSIIIRVIEHDAQGRDVNAREAQVYRLEEVSVVAPRLAQAMASGRSLAQTRGVSNLSIAETRPQLKIRTEELFTVGIGGQYMLGNDELPSAIGVELGLHRQSARYDFGGNMRFLGSSKAGMFALGVSGRYFFTEDDFSPFLGGGLNLLSLSAQNNDVEYRKSTLGVQLEAGVEFMRFSDSRVGALVRVDLPFASLDAKDSTKKDSLYVVPVGLFAYYSF